MITFLENLLGANWRTSIWGFFTAVCLFLYANPDVLAPLPDYWEHLSKQILTFLMAGGVVKMGTSARDRKTSEQDKQASEEKAVETAKLVAIHVEKQVVKLNEKVADLQEPKDAAITNKEVQNSLNKIEKLKDAVKQGDVVKKLNEN